VKNGANLQNLLKNKRQHFTWRGVHKTNITPS